jgi:membrane associated rhomboid family serine protease
MKGLVAIDIESQATSMDELQEPTLVQCFDGSHDPELCDLEMGDIATIEHVSMHSGTTNNNTDCHIKMEDQFFSTMASLQEMSRIRSVGEDSGADTVALDADPLSAMEEGPVCGENNKNDNSDVASTGNDASQVVPCITSNTMEDGIKDILEQRLADFQAARSFRFQFLIMAGGLTQITVYSRGVREDLRWVQDVSNSRKQRKTPNSWEEYTKSRLFPRLCVPWFTMIFWLACIVVYILTLRDSGWQSSSPTYEATYKFGLCDGYAIVSKDEWYRLFMPMNLHSNPSHLVGNLAFGVVYGLALESLHGSLIVASLAFASGVGANLACAVMLPDSPSLEASSVVFGLMGIMLAYTAINFDLLVLSAPCQGKVLSFFWVFIPVFVDVAINVIPGFDNETNQIAHVSGLVYGFGLGMILPYLRSSGTLGSYDLVLGQLIRLTIFICACLSAIYLFRFLWFHDENKPWICPLCRQFNCIELPPWSGKKWWSCGS